jgi:hypothetical protein
MSDNCMTCAEVTEQPVTSSTLNDIWEIHVTVASGDVASFQEDCRRIDVKAIVLDLHIKKGGVMKDLMTSSQYRGNYEGVIVRAVEIVAALSAMGYNVVRQKIETTPRNSMTPSRANGFETVPEGTYFESHIPALIRGEHEMSVLSWLAVLHDLHVSRNTFKMDEKGRRTVMLTKRSRTLLYEDFVYEVDEDIDAIKFSGIQVEDKVIVEYVAMDSRIEHDKAWTGLAA